MNKRKEKTIRIIVIVLLLLILLALHILGPSYFAPNSIFINSFLVDILLPCYLFLLLTFKNRKKQMKILFAIGVFLIGFIVETLQYFGVPILGRTFDVLDYPMYLLGTLAGVGIDALIIRLSKDSQEK